MVATTTRYAHPSLAPLNHALGRLRFTIDEKMWTTAGLWVVDSDPDRLRMPTFYEPGSGVLVDGVVCAVIERTTGCGALARKRPGRRDLIQLLSEEELLKMGDDFIQKVVAAIDARISF